MKTVYIAKGETGTYENLTAEHLIVDGHLRVSSSIKAKRISGRGVIEAETVSADDIVAHEIEATTVVCRKLLARRVYASEVFASDSAAVSEFLSSAYVETGKLTVAVSEIDELKTEETIHLAPGKRGLLLTLLMSVLCSVWLQIFSRPKEKPKEAASSEPEKKEPEEPSGEDPADALVREEIARIVREVLQEQGRGNDPADEEDFELKRFIGMFKMLRHQGYTLRVLPGTPEESAPTLQGKEPTLNREAA